MALAVLLHLIHALSEMIVCEEFDLHPSVYKSFMMSLSIIIPPASALALFCILTKSPKQIGSYKWYLLAYQMASTTYDFVFTTLIVPVVFFPIPMGYPGSVVSEWTSLTTQTSLIMFVFSVSLLSSAILSLFVYRCHLVMPNYHFLKINNKGHAYISVALLFFYCLPVAGGLVNISPDQLEAKQWVLAEYSCAKLIIDTPRFHVYTPSSIRPLVITASVLGIFAGIVMLYAVLLSFHFLSRANHVSQRTRRMQKKYLIYLCVQVLIPLLSLLLPVLALMYMFGTSFVLTQNEGNFALCCMALHGFISPLSLIVCNDAYRNFILQRAKYGCARIKRKFEVIAPKEQYTISQIIS